MEEKKDKTARIRAAQFAREIVKETAAQKQTQREKATERVVLDKALQALIGWKPHKNQQGILDSNSQDVVICAGRRFGKSSLCAYVALRALLENKNVLLVAPTYELTRRVSDYLRTWIGKSFKNEIRWVERPLPHIITIWKSFLDCRSADEPDQILGKEYDLVIVDECSRVLKKVHEIYIIPASGRETGKYFYISTPLGENWFHKKWIGAKETQGAFQYRSLDNPFFDKEKWEEAKAKLPEQVFKQEYEASFLPGAAAVFRGIREIIGDECLDEPKGHKYFLGVDLGKHEDFTVLTVLDKYTHKVVSHERFKRIHYPLQKERIIATAKKYNNARVIIDSTGIGEPIYDDLRHEGLLIDDFKISGASKSKLIDKLSIYIQQKAITIPDLEVLVDELGAYGYNISPSGKFKYSAPSGLHDDCVISLALAVWGLSSIKTQNPAKLIGQRPNKVKEFQYF